MRFERVCVFFFRFIEFHYKYMWMLLHPELNSLNSFISFLLISVLLLIAWYLWHCRSFELAKLIWERWNEFYKQTEDTCFLYRIYRLYSDILFRASEYALIIADVGIHVQTVACILHGCVAFAFRVFQAILHVIMFLCFASIDWYMHIEHTI